MNYLLAGLSAYMQMQSAQATAKGVAAQASFSKQQSRSEALKYKAQGVAILDNILATDALIVAKAGSGSVDPASGSAMTLSTYALAKGIEEKMLADSGATIALRSGMLKAQQEMLQAEATILSGAIGAATAFGEAYTFEQSLGKRGQ